jgi:hypothetical protein
MTDIIAVVVGWLIEGRRAGIGLVLSISQKLKISIYFKGIDRPFRRGVKSSLIRSLFINWRLGNFFLLILKGFHHKISKKPIDAA